LRFLALLVKGEEGDRGARFDADRRNFKAVASVGFAATHWRFPWRQAAKQS
jgi:hypothetical protein